LVFEGLFGRQRSLEVDANASERNPAPRRPIIGLALGGGAARGFAHIGIMRVLLKHGIVPDVIAGTSIGAVVGGCFAAGKLDELEEWAMGLQPRRILGYLDISLGGSGLIGGERLNAQLAENLGKVLIEDLPLKVAAIATEVRTGHEIWLTRGRLVDAIRASYALPGIFTPVSVGDRWLVDGALVNPVPVSAARAMGAEIVIAVNVTTDVTGPSHGTTIPAQGSEPDHEDQPEPKPKRGGLSQLFSAERTLKRQFIGSNARPGLSTVMVDAFNIMQDRITRARLAGDPPDVTITPRMGQVGWFDFHRGVEAIDIGTEAAEKAMPSVLEAVTALAHPADAGGK
jgi:NTE family protein